MTHDLKTSLEELTEAAYADAPPSTVDIAKAQADGRRRMVVNRLAPIGGGVAVVAACALVVNALGGTSPAGKNGADASTPGARTFAGTDPLTSIASFGWLPDGFQTAGWTTGSFYGDGIVARSKTADDRTAGPESPVQYNLSKWTSEPSLQGGMTKQAVALKGSKQAYVVTNPASGPGIPADLSLSWQTPSGSWYTLQGDYSIHGAELVARLTRIAESVDYQETPVALPFHLEGLPAGVQLGEAMLNDPAQAGDAGFTAGVIWHTGGTLDKDASFEIEIRPTAGQPKPTGKETVVPLGGGVPGGNVADPGTCKEEKGLHICVHDHPIAGLDPLARVGGEKGLLARITSLGTDKKNWTTNVVN